MAINTDKIRWADNIEVDPISGLPNKSEPPEELKLSGTKRAQNLTRQHFNYILDQYHEMFGDLQQQINDLTVSAGIGTLQIVFPVGSYYTNAVSNANPNTLLGFGTWVRVLGKFIVGVDEADTTWDAGLKIGGNKNHAHTASASTAGSHSHGSATGAGGAHNHTVSRDGWGQVGLPPGTLTSGRLVTGSGQSESSETLESIRNAANDVPTSSVGNHTHSISSDGGHTHVVTVTNAANVPPFEAAFIWRRTA